jgi:hypothetical protein
MAKREIAAMVSKTSKRSVVVTPSVGSAATTAHSGASAKKNGHSATGVGVNQGLTAAERTVVETALRENAANKKEAQRLLAKSEALKLAGREREADVLFKKASRLDMATLFEQAAAYAKGATYQASQQE